MAFRIYPSIGVARVGNDLTQFYIGSEIPGHPGFDVDDQGTETPITQYKVGDDQDLIKRQAARFRLFEVDGGGVPRPAQLPAGASVEWTVHLVNKKAAVQRSDGPLENPTRPQLVANPGQFLIDPGPRSIAGASASGVKFDTGAYQGRHVPLGEIRTDKNQNLLVLGGFGFSSSPTNRDLSDFYTNPGWHDDTSDGPVTARIRLANGSTIDDIAPAWVAVGPPDYAPEIQGVVSLYDIMLQVAIDQLGVPRPNQVSFTRDIFPMLLRTRRYQWVNQAPKVEDRQRRLARTRECFRSLRGLAREQRRLRPQARIGPQQLSPHRPAAFPAPGVGRGPLPVRLARRAAAGKYRHGGRDDARSAAIDGRPRLFPGHRSGNHRQGSDALFRPLRLPPGPRPGAPGRLDGAHGAALAGGFHGLPGQLVAIATARRCASRGVVCQYLRLGPRRDYIPGNGAQFPQARLHHGAEGRRGKHRVCRGPAGTERPDV